MNTIYPRPLRITRLENYFSTTNKDLKVYFEKFNQNVFNELKTFVLIEEGSKDISDICYLIDGGLNEQAYKLEINENKILIYACNEIGFFYATKTLKQIYSNNMECVTIFDEPDLKVRGFMYDISRNKVPLQKTVEQLIDIMSDLKMNHLELYVEGFSFELKSFKKYLTEESYITNEEFVALEKYASDHFIDLVPNLNGFGHMAAWLALDDFKDLAEAPDGNFRWGLHYAPSTLNPLDPRSINMVKQMYNDVLPISTSKYFNMNFDEPFELGTGKSKEAVDKKGLANVYLDYTLQAYEEIKKFNKTPIIWGDVLMKHPESLDRLPKDMIFAEWGYDSFHPFKENLLKLKNAGIKFIAAPGTSTWNSIFGRTHDAFETILNSTYYTKLYGGEGILLTDWGDNGHYQMLPATYPSLVYSALLSYRTKEGTYRDVKNYLNKYIFKDDTGIMGDLMIDLGNYYRYENDYSSNATHLFQFFRWTSIALKEKEGTQVEFYYQKMKDKILPFCRFELLSNYFDSKLNELQFAHIDELVRDEVKFSIILLKYMLRMNVGLNPNVNNVFRIKNLEEIVEAEEKLVKEYKRLWLSRNKISCFDESSQNIFNLVKMAKLILGGLYEKKN